MLVNPVHPQFGVEQLVCQVLLGTKHYFYSDIQNAFFCYPIKKGENGSDITCLLTHLGKLKFNECPQGLNTSQFTLSETMSKMMDTSSAATTTVTTMMEATSS